ncbi:MAG: MYG1 family protein [Candidatus Paceibacterota bacterium]
MARPIVVTHSGDFHADDIFAVATLRMVLGDIEIVRTRNEDLIKNGDYVVDVGAQYDPQENRFDHHQKGGGGERENGIPYASFGLVWKEYGESLSGSVEAAEHIDRSLIQPIDAVDNGVEIATALYDDVYPRSMNSIASAFRPTWNEDNFEEEYFKRFLYLVDAAEVFLKRLIDITNDYIEAQSYVRQAYEDAQDKRLIILDRKYPWREILTSFPEPIYVVYDRGDTWGVKAVPADTGSFENRKDLPAEWAGKRDDALVAATGVSDAVFCHNARFLAVADSKEGALELARKALES